MPEPNGGDLFCKAYFHIYQFDDSISVQSMKSGLSKWYGIASDPNSFSELVGGDWIADKGGM